MFDFIPVEEYTNYFNITVLIMVLLAFWQCNNGIILKKDVVALNGMWGVLFTIVLVFYMGLRPVSEEFGDTVNYAEMFDVYQRFPEEFERIGTNGEWFFNYIYFWFSQHSDIHSFFLFCAILYVVPLWIAMYRIFKDYYYIPYLVLISMFSFWSYGVNGIRNGIASSIIILALTFVNRRYIMLFLCLLAVGTHKSLWLLVVSGLISWYYKNTKFYLLGWTGSIVVSFLFGAIISNYLVALGIISDDRFAEYLSASSELSYQFSSTGFRWDFLVFSTLPVTVGYYFIFRRDFKDEYYQWMYNIYLISNAFWIIVIRAEFSNRFAQLSWFIMPIILIYPFLKKRFWIHHERVLGLVLLIFYMYTFYSEILR